MTWNEVIASLEDDEFPDDGKLRCFFCAVEIDVPDLCDECINMERDTDIMNIVDKEDELRALTNNS